MLARFCRILLAKLNAEDDISTNKTLSYFAVLGGLSKTPHLTTQ